MIDLYAWSTPNGFKATIMIEECGLDARLHPVDLGKGEQHAPDFLAVNPNGKIPAMVDNDGPEGDPVTIFESGAMLLYLAEKSGLLLPEEPAARWQAVSWLMFQMGGVGPMLGQAGYFIHRAPEPMPLAVDRFIGEAERLYGVVDRRLRDADFLAGSYSVADIACFPWMRNHTRFQIDIDEFPNVSRWLAAMAGRPAVQRGLAAFNG
jgi:GST-like protein